VGVTVGANRNALLLHTVGEYIFHSDDDVICRVAASPGFKEGFALNSQGYPIQYWFYPDRESLLASVQPVEQDLLALHEQWLGQDPLASGAPYSRTDHVSVEQAGPAFLRRLATRPRKIISTAHGFVGTLSAQEPADLLFSVPPESRKRLLSSEQTYVSARTTREIGEAVCQITLTANAHPYAGMYIGGLDNRELLPPSTPVGWSEDLAFSIILNKCFPDADAIYLPWVVLHAPLEARPHLELSFDVPFNKWLLNCIEFFHPEQISTPTDHLSQLGQFLEKIGSLPVPAFEEFARQALWQREGARISILENVLCQDEGLLASYRQDIEAHCAKMRQGMMLPVRQRMVDGPEIVQRALRQFAEILHWWPAIRETARCLRTDGIRLAQPI